MPKKILVVDESKDMRVLLYTYIARANREVITISDESEGFLRAQAEQFDLIIVGINSSNETSW